MSAIFSQFKSIPFISVTKIQKFYYSGFLINLYYIFLPKHLTASNSHRVILLHLDPISWLQFRLNWCAMSLYFPDLASVSWHFSSRSLHLKKSPK